MKRFLVLLPLLALLSGCGSNSNRRVELNENTGQLLPVSALAMDTHKRGYTMTVESIRQDSLNGDAAPAYFTVEGETFDELFQRADELLASRLYLSHAQAVVVSPSIAQNALPALVDCLLGRPDARLTLRIAVARGAAPDEVLRADAVVEGLPGVALAALLDQRAADGSMADCPLFRLLDREMSHQPFSLPVLKLSGDGHAAPDGSVQISDDGMTFTTGGERHA